MNNTKKKILEVSLNLFSKNGFSSVSIRDICKQVDIKESSIYYHFKNKQAIFDELLNQFQIVATTMMNTFETSLRSNDRTLNKKNYNKVCDYFFEEYLMNDFCNKVMRMLSIEQLNSNEIQKIYDTWLFNEPLKFQSQIFSQLTEIGYIQKIDSDFLAVKYYAPIFLFAQRFLFSGKLNEENKNSFLIASYEHINAFFAEMGVK